MDYYERYLCYPLILFLISLALCITSFAIERIPEVNTIERITPDSLMQSRPWSIRMGIGAPVPLTIGAILRSKSALSFYLDAGYLPVPISSSVSYRGLGIETGALWSPLNHGFFLSSGLGFQQIQITTRLNLGSISPSAEPEPGVLSFNQPYVTLSIGYSWKISDRVSLDADLGLQVPFLTSTQLKLKSESPASSSLERSAKDPLSYFSKFLLPKIHLIRLQVQL